MKNCKDYNTVDGTCNETCTKCKYWGNRDACPSSTVYWT